MRAELDIMSAIEHEGEIRSVRKAGTTLVVESLQNQWSEIEPEYIAVFDGLGIDSPRMSRLFATIANGFHQSGYRIVSREFEHELPNAADTWNGELPVAFAMGPVFMAYISACLLYTSPSPRDLSTSRMPSSA